MTISNQEPENYSIVSPIGGLRISEQILNEKNFNIVIPPKDMFISEVIMISAFINYYKGYYKLRLFYTKTGQCVAEIVVKR